MELLAVVRARCIAVRVHFVSHSVSRVLPPSEAVAVWTLEVANRLAKDQEVVVWGRRYPEEPSTVRKHEVRTDSSSGAVTTVPTSSLAGSLGYGA